MPGFLINNYGSGELLDESSDNYLIENCHYQSYFVQRCTTTKFLCDKTLFQNEEYIILLEGVLLNKKDLYQKYQAGDVANLAIVMYCQIGETFFSEFRGSFSGGIYDKKKDEWVIFTNHYGDNAVYYFYEQGKVIVASQLKYIANVLKKNGVIYSLEESAVHAILTYGYMPDDRTYLQGVKRLYPGHYIKIQNGSFTTHKYFSIRQDVYDLSGIPEEEIIEEMDRKFRAAIRLEYEKDLEYGYRHLTQLSGGLDSRMNLWVATEMGYQDILCMTFAQSGCLDEKVAKEIAAQLGVEILVWPLDSAKHLFRIDDYIGLNGGTALYSGIGGEIEILQSLNQEMFGLVHTGQIGDVVIGTFISNPEEMQDMSVGGAYSQRLVDGESDKAARGFENREQYLMFTRAFMGCLSSHFFTRHYTEVASPFLNVEFFEYCMSIPLELRINHTIYKKWIVSKYPKAADFIWEKLGRKITDNPPNRFMEKVKLARKYPKLILKKLGLPVQVEIKMTEGMNPYDLWWENNRAFRNLYDEYYRQHIEHPIFSEEIKKQLNILYNEGSANEKTQVITALAAVSFFFDEK